MGRMGGGGGEGEAMIALDCSPDPSCTKMVGNISGVEGQSNFAGGDRRNISMKFFQNLSSYLGGEVILRFAFFLALVAIMFSEQNDFEQFY